MSEPLVIAWQYINNGLASWGWEAAHALAESGEDVLLVHAEGFPISPPMHPRVRLLAFSPSWAKGSGPVFRLRRRLGRDIGHVLLTRNGFTYDLHRHLRQNSITPRAYLLNQSDLVDERVATPQYPVAWGYPTDLRGYIEKTSRYTGGADWWSPKGFGTTRFSLGWYRRDWRAYRRATGGVLSVSHRIAADLRAAGVRNVCVVHPGTNVPMWNERDNDKTKAESAEQTLRIITVAVELEDPRKRVRWMLEALHAVSDPKFSLTVVGKASPEFERWATEASRFPICFTGPVSREEAQALMAEQDLFLFGSRVDDWGYVLIEAMGQGLTVAAPDQSPFDEILGDTGVLYAPDDKDSLTRHIAALSDRSLESLRRASYERAVQKFSRAAFAQSLRDAVKPPN